MFRNPTDPLIGGLDLFGVGHQFMLIKDPKCTNAPLHGPHVPNAFDDISGTGFPFGSNHRGAFTDTTKSLAQVPAAADKRHVEPVFVDMVFIVRRRQDLTLVDEVDLESLEHASLGNVPDSTLCHHRNLNSFLDFLDRSP